MRSRRRQRRPCALGVVPNTVSLTSRTTVIPLINVAALRLSTSAASMYMYDSIQPANYAIISIAVSQGFLSGGISGVIP